MLVQEGEWVEVNFRLLQRDKSFWGDDAEQFNPDRWATIRPIWEYLPFSGGPRICPAIRLVHTECAYIMAIMARAFHTIVNRDPVMEWVEERRLIFQSKNGTKVGLLP
jgi:cytochrome P450